MIINGESVTIQESMFSEWVIWHGTGINAIHTACETNVPITDGYKIPLELLIAAMLEHTCDRWAAATKGSHNDGLANSNDPSSAAVGVPDVARTDRKRSSGRKTGDDRRRSTGTFTG